MSLFLQVITQVTLPIVALIALGVLLQRRAGVQVGSMNRLVLFGTLPALLIHSLATADLPLVELRATVLVTLVQFFGLLFIGWGLGALCRLPPLQARVLGMAAAFPNSGNFGIPVIELAFGTEWVLHQAVIVSLHTILLVALAPFLLSTEKRGGRAVMGALFQTPLLPAVALGLALNAADLSLPSFVSYPLTILGAANTPVALIALGAQIGAGLAEVSLASAGLGALLRLVLAPAATWLGLLWLSQSWMAPPDTVHDLLLVGSGAPVGVLLAILCTEYRAAQSQVSAIVLLTTALSPLVVTLLVLLARAG